MENKDRNQVKGQVVSKGVNSVHEKNSRPAFVKQSSSNSKSNKSPTDYSVEDADQVPDEETTDAQSPKLPKFQKSRVGLVDKQPMKHRFSITGERDKLIPLEYIHNQGLSKDLDPLNLLTPQKQHCTPLAIKSFTYEVNHQIPRNIMDDHSDGIVDQQSSTQNAAEVLSGSRGFNKKNMMKVQSQDYDIRLIGSGIPMLGINEQQCEESISSGNYESDQEDDKISVSKLERDNGYPGIEEDMFHFKLNDISDQQEELQNELSFAEGVLDAVLKDSNANNCVFAIQNENQEDYFNFIDSSKVEDEEKKGSGTPKFGDTNKFSLFKFIYRNEQQRSRYVNDLTNAFLIWYHIHSSSKKHGKCAIRSNSYLPNDSNTTSTESQQSQRQTIVFCDLHKLLIYIRKVQQNNHDYLIRAKSNGIAVKFYISIRRNLVQALQKLANDFDLVIYTSLDKEMGDAILDYIEQNLAGGKKLFQQRFHAIDCEVINLPDLDITDLKQRNLKIIIQSQFSLRSTNQLMQNAAKQGYKLKSEKNIIFVSSNLKEVAKNLQNVVPIKSYDGKRSKNATLMNLVQYLQKKFAVVDDVRDVINKDFLQLSPDYPDYTDLLQKIYNLKLYSDDELDDSEL